MQRRIPGDAKPPRRTKPRAARDGGTPRTRFTFHGNLEETRHGWIRLTPAYSVHLVRELLAEVSPAGGTVLDPFCGTGTTLLACAERGFDATTVDLNPFLVWLARAKTARYDSAAIAEAERLVERMAKAARAPNGERFVPPIHRVERWWAAPVLGALGRAAATLRTAESATNRRAHDLAALALCRAVIGVANVSFGHQSMSFRKGDGGANGGGRRSVSLALEKAIALLVRSAATKLPASRLRVIRGDSRELSELLPGSPVGRVLTSPPYSNRMSYIRELRPYMYWLGYLTARRDAGDLDWQAIGGTWGAATSRLSSWRPRRDAQVPFDGFDRIVARIAEREPLLGSYVHRYFEDMVLHVRGLSRVVAPGGTLHYVVGNSKFYDVLLPAQEIFAALFEAEGFERSRVTVLRKRTSKRELFEYLVEAAKPQGRPVATPRPSA